MAGKRHHHVWQMLQRGFSWEENGGRHIYVYKKGETPKQTTTKKYGQEKKFYGEIGSLADEKITNFENDIQEFVIKVRSGHHTQQVDSYRAGQLVSHLEIRSQFLRSHSSQMAARLTTGMEKIFTHKDYVKEMMSNYFHNHPEMVDEYFDKEEVPAEYRKIALEYLITCLPQELEAASNDLINQMPVLFASLQGLLVQAIRDAHIESLERDFTEFERTHRHQELDFHVWRTSDGLILPDTGLVVFKENGCAPITQKGDEVDAIFVPLSTQVALVGTKDGKFDRSVKTLRRSLASCAFESFIAPVKSDELTSLATRISKNANLISDSDIRRMLDPKKFMQL